MQFLTGVYGMNFEHMPELGWEYSYYTFWGVSVFLFITVYLYFKRLRWL